MAATTLSINRGIDVQANGTTTFYTSTSGRILNITLKVSSTLPITDNQNVSAISLTVSAGGTSITTDTKVLENGAIGYDLTFSIGLDFEEYTYITISPNCSNTVTYYANTTYAHTGITLVSSGAHNILIHITYEQHWTYVMDDGYFAEAGSEASEFRYFSTDLHGVPYNGGAWKIDFRNDGYPWLVSTQKTLFKGTLYYKYFDEALQQVAYKPVTFIYKYNSNGVMQHLPIRLIYKR